MQTHEAGDEMPSFMVCRVGSMSFRKGFWLIN